MISTPKIYYISQGETTAQHLQHIKEMVDAGVDWVQLRLKEISKPEILKTALEANSYCHEKGVKFILNDYPEIAKAVNADGVHLGKEDLAVNLAKEIFDQDKIIGGTANTWEDCQQLIEQQVDYIGLGPFRFTTTKKKLSPVLGFEGYEKIIQKMKSEKVSIPIIAIGGITLEDILELLKIGVDGIALSGYLHQQNQLSETIQQIKELYKTPTTNEV